MLGGKRVKQAQGSAAESDTWLSLHPANLRHGVFAAVGLCDADNLVVGAANEGHRHAAVRSVPALFAVLILHDSVEILSAITSPMAPCPSVAYGEKKSHSVLVLDKLWRLRTLKSWPS